MLLGRLPLKAFEIFLTCFIREVLTNVAGFQIFSLGPCSVSCGEKCKKRNPRAKRAERKLSSRRGKGCIIVVMSSLVNMCSDVM